MREETNKTLASWPDGEKEMNQYRGTPIFGNVPDDIYKTVELFDNSIERKPGQTLTDYTQLKTAVSIAIAQKRGWHEDFLLPAVAQGMVMVLYNNHHFVLNPVSLIVYKYLNIDVDIDEDTFLTAILHQDEEGNYSIGMTPFEYDKGSDKGILMGMLEDDAKTQFSKALPFIVSKIEQLKENYNEWNKSICLPDKTVPAYKGRTLQDYFTYHPPNTDAQIKSHEAVNSAAIAFAEVLLAHVDEDDFGPILDMIQMARMKANQAVSMRFSR